jgi:hypothetical protein
METALRLDEEADSESAYDNVPDLPGVSDDGPQGRAADTRAAVQAQAQTKSPKAAKPTEVERPAPPVAPQAPKAQPIAPKPQAAPQAPTAMRVLPCSGRRSTPSSRTPSRLLLPVAWSR